MSFQVSVKMPHVAPDGLECDTRVPVSLVRERPTCYSHGGYTDVEPALHCTECGHIFNTFELDRLHDLAIAEAESLRTER